MAERNEMENGAAHDQSTGLMTGHSTEDESQCGIGSFRPRCVQRFANIKSFVVVAALNSVIITTMTIYIGGLITTLEKRFGFRSVESGLLVSAHEIGNLVTILVISHFGVLGNIPRILGVSSFVAALGALLRIVPHMLYGSGRDTAHALENFSNFSSSLEDVHLCDANRSLLVNTTDNCLVTASTIEGAATDGHQKITALILLIIGQILEGVGFAPLHTLGVTYIDNNVPKAEAAGYISIIESMFTVGVLLGYMLASAMTSLDIDLITIASGLTPEHPEWLGAWWLGYVPCGILCIFTGLPLLLFPKRLPSALQQKQKLKDENKPGFVSLVKEMPKAVFRIFSNFVYVSMLIGAVADSYIVAGFYAYLPKYWELQFKQTAWSANIAAAIIAAFSGGLGLLTGGFIISKFKFGKRKMALQLTISTLTTLIGVALLIAMNCPTLHVDGSTESQNLTVSCNQNCACAGLDFQPICGSDYEEYFSPCHAGCEAILDEQGEITKYSNCSCIADGMATDGPCPQEECSMHYAYGALLFLSTFCLATGAIPWIMLTIRCVSETDRALALGMNTFVSSLFGFFPAPILYGKWVDMTCTSWETSCEDDGHCRAYNMSHLNYMLHGSTICFLAIAVLSYVVTTYKVSRMKSSEEDEKGSGNNTDGEPSGLLMLEAPESRDQENNVLGEKGAHSVL